MSSHTPEFLDPWSWADTEKRVDGAFALAELERLAPLLLHADGEVGFTLRAGRDPLRRACIEGRLHAVLQLECQRCLGPVELVADRAIRIMVAEGIQEMERIPEDWEPLLMEEPRIRLQTLIEDELLLELPQVARHPAGRCTIEYDGEPAPLAAEEPDRTVSRVNPFAELATLKTKRSD